MKHRKATKKEYNSLVEIWSKSVKQTHDFLRIEDFEAIKQELPTYFPNLDVQLWFDQEKMIGFSGVDGNKIEMLFLDPAFIGQGYGRQILTDLFNEQTIQFVDVNEQNKSAKAFYQVMGFTVYDRSEVDEASRAYPILHLRK
ncbi:GNAT family N-acetyltransferase [Candidatus Enterococcus mansonii]|uniref:N-acetyltransferase domain-containing protein n=1 Tax=Candidatus Enterococcus mansonii TaxID=1834181 RepID=A0A242CHT9_9ENTE|nr:GNAT family N-acetyltransferase [Enterococcus sp. 4G2_DIV0659]OTO09342.1 hypothetical protein A5880_000021 [Enterococcus sp. 4G2_DIV0659]